jgi:Fe-S cluster assembly ATP-binding protein
MIKANFMGKIEIKNVNLSLSGKKILDDISIDFWDGYIHAVVGPNGAGKSTLASVIMGLDGYRDIEGEIFFNGKLINDLSIDERAKKGITLFWQEPARFEGLSVKRFIQAGARDKSEENIINALLTVGMQPENYLYRAVDKTLSGGERKKIELASILAMQPKVVLMDEPDSGIDVASLNKIFGALDVLKEQKSTVILITHSATVVKHAEHAFLMCGGKITYKGSVDKILPYFQESCIPCDHKNEPTQIGSSVSGEI